MGRIIAIVLVLLVAAGGFWLWHRAGDSYHTMEKATKALESFGVTMDMSADCETWITGDDSRKAMAAKSLMPSKTNFNFARMKNAGAESIIALDADPSTLLLLREKDSIWLAERGGWVINMGTGGYLGVTPAAVKPQEKGGVVSAMQLLAALGANKGRETALARDAGQLFLVQHGPEGFLACNEKTGCAFTQNGGKVYDPDDLAAMKKKWDRAGAGAVGAACKALNDPTTRAALNRYDAIQGACHGQPDTKPLKATYDQRVADCAAYSAKIAPKVEAFFAVQ